MIPWCSKTLKIDGTFHFVVQPMFKGYVSFREGKCCKHVGVECDSSIGQYDGIHIRPKSGRKPKLHSAKFVKPSRIRIEILDMPLFWGGLETYHIKNKLCAHH